MKKFFFLVFILLTGCSAKYPPFTNLQLHVGSQPATMYHNGATAALTGHDARPQSAVVVFQLKNKPEIQIPNETAPHFLVTKQLAKGLEQQGLVFAGGSPVRIQLDLNELLVTVTRPQLLFRATAKSHLTLTINNKGFSLTKTYDREAVRDSVTRPPVQDLEKMLNDQLTDIVDQILLDEEIRTIIDKK